MFLIITAFAAIVTTVVYYTLGNKYGISTLCFIYWGATLMWLVDLVKAYITEGGFAEFTLNSALLGVAVVAIGLIVWLILLLFRNYKNKKLIVQQKTPF